LSFSLMGMNAYSVEKVACREDGIVPVQAGA
jgi:hypothetical protein